MATRAARPGPLRPYPIELFKADSKVPGTPSKHLRPNKRPFSPTLGHIDSPAKRRLKAEEGITTRSPLSATSNSARFAPVHFHALLQGPGSPAKKLDFRSSKSSADGSPSGTSTSTACDTPRSGSHPPKRSPKRASGIRVRRSPWLSARASSVSSERPAVEEQPMAAVEVIASSNGLVSTAEPILVPRKLIPLDPQSIHYPGFNIYRDPHVVLPATSSITRYSATDASNSTTEESASDKDLDKENVRPARRSTKKTGAPMTPSDTSLMKAVLLSPSSKHGVLESAGKPKLVPASPHPRHVCDYLSAVHVTPKARSLRTTTSPASTLVGVTPGRTPLDKEERRLMRRAMEEEVDDSDGEDEL
ncbi:hypothetical protein C8Q78DRAFT_1002564 [Trametes maxima]|nr:hypothetical protein C8Q78DRAFT_1002564 [Trametes maxima]